MKNRLSPELEQVQDLFIERLSEGGIAAAETFVAELSVQDEALIAFNNVALAIEHEDLRDVAPAVFSDFYESFKVIDFIDEIRAEGIVAMSRRSFALIMLETVRSKGL